MTLIDSKYHEGTTRNYSFRGFKEVPWDEYVDFLEKHSLEVSANTLFDIMECEQQEIKEVLALRVLPQGPGNVETTWIMDDFTKLIETLEHEKALVSGKIEILKDIANHCK